MKIKTRKMTKVFTVVLAVWSLGVIMIGVAGYMGDNSTKKTNTNSYESSDW